MPNIDLISPVYYNPNDPYHWEVDNLPLKAINDRQELINLALDQAIQQLADAAGTQGTFANRIDQSINPDGSLKSSAVDDTMHTMDDHTDTLNYVRMTKAQSDKLDGVASGATNLEIEADSVTFDSGTLVIQASTTITPSVTGPNILKFNMAFPAEAAHQHFYGLTPAPANISTPDYINYKTTSMSTPCMDGTLRVYINGVRIFSDVSVYVPGALVDDPWTLLQFTPDEGAGTFALSAAIQTDDIIKIDFDVSLS